MVKLKIKKPTAGGDELKKSSAKPLPIKLKLSKPEEPKVKPTFKIKLGSKPGSRPGSKPGSKPPVEKKATTTAAPKLRLKMQRIPGEGYDSEDSEAEEDPLREESIVLRLLPDAELDYVRHCVESGDLSSIQIRWKDRLRCVLRVNKTLYAAKLMNLPNIIEAHKTVDKKNIFKTVDISQILLVIRQIHDESELESISPREEMYDSGVSLPLKNISKSKYRRKLTKEYIQNIEARVDELLRLDEESMETMYEMVDSNSIIEPETIASSQRVDTFMEDDHVVVPVPKKEEVEEEPIDDDLELELEQALEEDVEEEEDEDDDDDEEDENSDNEAGMHRKVEIDEDAQHNALLKDEINDVMATIAQNKLRLDKTSNPLLRNRILDSITKLEKELENKQKQLKTSEDKTKIKNQDQDQQEEEDEEDGDADGDADGEDQEMDDNDDDDEGEGEVEDEDDDEDEEDEQQDQEDAEDQRVEGAEDEFDDLEELFG